LGGLLNEAKPVRLVALLAALALSACGYIGPPLARTLDIPQTVGDLVVAEYGSNILVEFTVPPLTTEGLPLKSLRSLDLRIGVPPTPWSENAWAASAKPIDCTATVPGPVTCQTPAAEWIGKETVIRVRATGPKGKTSEWSSVKVLPVQPPLAAPTGVKVVNTPQGLYVSWISPAKKFRLFRAVGDAQPELLSQLTDPNWMDPEVDFGTEYRYFVQAVAGELQQSETAGSAPVTRSDTFAPSVPANLIAEPGANTIELSWDRNTDPRFQGYNVYRAVENGPFEKIASLITAPAYTDPKVETGKKYRYMVSGVGTNGMESEKSAPAEATAQ